MVVVNVENCGCAVILSMRVVDLVMDVFRYVLLNSFCEIAVLSIHLVVLDVSTGKWYIVWDIFLFSNMCCIVRRVSWDVQIVMCVFPSGLSRLIHVLKVVDWLHKPDVVCSPLLFELVRTFCFDRDGQLLLSLLVVSVSILVLDFVHVVPCHTSA